MRALLLVLLLALAAGSAAAAAPFAASQDREVCHDTPDLLFACAGGGVQGDCEGAGYRYDQVLLMTAAGYVWVIGDSYCWTADGETYEDQNLIVGVGTPVASASLWWYANDESCRVMPRVYDPFGPLVVENLDCPAGQRPPDPGWGSLLL